MIEERQLIPDDFVQVSPELVQQMGGNVMAVFVMSRLHYRARWRGDGDGWLEITLTELADDTGLSPQQMQRTVARLVEEGYVEEQWVEGGGRRKKYRVVTKESTEGDGHSELNHPEEEASFDSESHSHLKSNNPPIYKKLRKEPPLEPPPAGSGVALFDVGGSKSPVRRPTKVAVREAFNVFWDIYPRKVAKPKAREAFEKAAERAGLQTILEGAKRYREDPNREPQFTAHPSTWLNQDRWGDDPLPGPTQRRSTTDQRVMAALELRDRYRAREAQQQSGYAEIEGGYDAAQ